jgi:hypothetical protein
LSTAVLTIFEAVEGAKFTPLGVSVEAVCEHIEGPGILPAITA